MRGGETIKTLSTTDYSYFKYIKGNRPILAPHVGRLIRSLAEENLLDIFPILVTEDMEIIDGQHRLAAAEKMNIPVYYTVVPRKVALASIQRVNTNSRMWTLRDYVLSQIEAGNKNYEMLLEFAKDYGTTDSIAAALLSGNMNTGGRGVFEKLKRGNLTITAKAKEFAYQIFDYIIDIEPYIEPGIKRNRYFVMAIDRILRNSEIDSKKLAEKIRTSHEKVKRQLNARATLEQLEWIYNKGEKNTVRFF